MAKSFFEDIGDPQKVVKFAHVVAMVGSLATVAKALA
jgi:hypothetical protein